MNDLWKRHWTTLVGSLFMVASLITLFKYTSDQGLLTDPVKIGIGLLAGAAFAAAGLTLHRKKRAVARFGGELGTGFGAAIWYTTCSYAGIYAAVWNSMTVLIVMSAITIGISLFAYRFGSRMLMSVGLGGALLAPLVMQPVTDQVFTLFLYLLIVNIAFFAISVMKCWMELRIAAFVLTWIMYAVYYFHFMPEGGEWWSMPMRYAIAAFLFYLIAFYAASWREKSGFGGANIYFSFANTVLFGIWAAVVLKSSDAMMILLTGIGVLYLALAALLYRHAGSNQASFYIHAAFGGLSLLLGMSNLGSGSELRPMIGVYVWTAIASLIMAAGYKLRKDWMKGLSSFIWLCTGFYWFVATWEVPGMNWFDVFVPFLNGGAVAWIGLAAFGFICSRKIRYSFTDTETNALFSNLYALGSHFVVGGLLTIQIVKGFEEYDFSFSMNLTLSVVWGMYALLLFVWGAYSRQKLFRFIGSVVLALVSLKALLLDLSDEATVYKMFVFIILGAISFGITWVNQRWRDKDEAAPSESAGSAVSGASGASASVPAAAPASAPSATMYDYE